MIIDLTMEVSGHTQPFPGYKGFEARLDTALEQGARVSRIALGTHFGTHIDAPYHMLAEGKKLDEYPAEALVGEAQIIDVVGVPEIKSEHLPSRLDAGILLFRTGHSEGCADPGYFQGNPVLTRDCAVSLAAQGVRIVGIDSFTVDNEPYDVHKILFQEEILILENLINLDRPGSRCRIIIAPLRLTVGDGAPARVYAEV